MTFFSQDYLKPQYFSSQLLHGALAPVEETARSGYWRLFFTQMQEDALKKRDQPTASQETNLEQVEGQATPQGTRKGKKRKPPVVAVEQFPEVRFKRKPIYANTEPVNEDFPEWVAQISLEMDSWYKQFRPLLNRTKQVIISSQKAIANDAEYRTRLILLFAA